MLLLAALLAAPWLAGKQLLPPRKYAYTEGLSSAPYAWLQQQIFEETNDIDIAFVGTSKLLYGIDTPQVQAKLTEHLGRPAVVRSLCWSGAGFDAQYVYIRDLLARRRVKLMVMYDELPRHRISEVTPHWFRYGDDAYILPELPVKLRLVYYFGAVVGMPNNLVQRFSPNLGMAPAEVFSNYYRLNCRSPYPGTRLGSLATQVGYDPHIGMPVMLKSPFVPYTPPVSPGPGAVEIYPGPGATNFVFSHDPVPEYQTVFARRFALEVKDHGCRLVVLHVPDLTEPGGRRAAAMLESRCWPDFFGMDVRVVGIPPERLFAGLSDREIERLYCDDLHFNENGQRYFTWVVIPALFGLYHTRSFP